MTLYEDAALTFLAFGGEAARLIEAFEWSKTSNGSIETWSQSLKTTLGIVLRSPVPMALLWGEDGVTLYNDAYSVFAGGRHPELLGRKVREGWPELADFHDNVMRVVLGGGTLAYRDHELTLYRGGVPERVFVNLDYSPVPNESGKPVGVLCILEETTHRVSAERAREAAQAALRASEAQLRSVIYNVPMGVGVFDADGRFTLRNPRLQALLGEVIPSRDESQAPRWQGFDAAGQLVERENYPGARALRGEDATAPVNFRRLGEDGPEHWLRVSAVALRAENEGAVIGGVSLVQDVTAELRVERTLRTTEERHRKTLEIDTVAIVYFDLLGGITDANDAFLNLVGYTRAELERGEVRYDNLTPPDWRWRDAQTLAELRATGQSGPFEKEYWRKDGSGLWILCASKLLDEHTAVEFLIDVTDRRRAEAALRASNGRFRAAVEATSGVLWTNDPSGRMLGEQPGWAALTGQSFAEYQGYGWADAVHPDDAPRTIDAWNEAVAERRTFVFEHRVRRYDGAWRLFAIRAIPILDDKGTVTEWVGVHTDVTEQRQAQESLREESHTLETLNRTGAALAAELDLERLVQTATDAGVELTGAGFGAFFYNVLNDAGESYMLYTLSGVDRSAFAAFPMPRATAVFKPTFVGEGVIRSDDILKDGRYGLSEPHRGMPNGHLPVRSYLAVPVMSRSGEVLGGLFFGHPETGRFTERHERLMVGIAGQAATAIDNARLFRAVQRSKETLEERVAEALAERRLLADIIDGTDVFVQVADREYNWLAINKAASNEFSRIFGVRRPTAGDNMLEMLKHRPADQRAVKTVWSRALEGEEFVETDTFGDQSLGRRYYEMRFRTLRDIDGEVIGAYQFVYDVTDRLREQQRLAKAEAARREADALYRAYFENTPEALFVVGVEPDGGFVVEEINPAHEAGVGLKLDEIRGKRIEEILPEPSAGRVLGPYRHVVETGAIYQYREEFDLRGEPQHWDTSLVPMRDESGRIVRLIGSSRNVTRQVVAEQALRQAQKMEAMGQLTGGVAHDFNNLLTPIVGSLDMLQRKGIGGEREQRLIAAAIQSADRAKTLVQRLLAFARRQPLQASAVDVVSLARGMADLIASTTGPHIKVVVYGPEELPAAEADPNQLEMAILNLAVNARDAMPDGGTLRISVELETVGPHHRAKLRPGCYLRLSVADTGSGMDEATLARAVEPFFSTKGVGRGTGLGLSMVHGLAAQLGGALTIQSRIGLGTNVELWLPQSETQPENSAPVPETPPIVWPKGTALLVDDEDAVRLSTADMLSELGYRVIEAPSAEEALRLLERGVRPDLLVTDHLMAGMSGTELARVVRATRPDTRVLIVSGYAEAEGIAPDLPRLTKPFRSADLVTSLAALIS